MKNLIYIFGLTLCVIVGVSSCNTDGLKDMDNPKFMLTSEYADLGFMFTNIQTTYASRGALEAIRIPAGYAKYYATHSTIMPGDRFQYNSGYMGSGWSPYTAEGKMAIHLIKTLEDMGDPAMSNNIAILKILNSAIFSWVTDIHGDVPYSEACQVFFTGNTFPKFDTQESIYKSILATLEEACIALDASKPVWSKYDIVYQGNISKWKMFGYSLMLRMAMRMSNVDAITAKTYAEKAIAGGVILDNADNFKIPCKDGQTSERNPITQGMIQNDPEKYWKLGKDFVDALKDNDPRAQVIFGGRLKSENPVPSSGLMNSRYWFDDAAWNYTIADQEGYPHGQNVQVTNYEDIQHSYTRQSRYIFDYESNIVRMAAHEMYFCIAKAAELGWNTGGRTAEAMYNAAVTANMKFYAQFAGTHAITDSEIADYLAYRPYSSDNFLRESWLSNYLDPFQAWFYIRQWGPDLTPNIANSSMPRRYAYPDAEYTRNRENYIAAFEQQGMNLGITQVQQFEFRCWWDVRR